MKLYAKIILGVLVVVGMWAGIAWGLYAWGDYCADAREAEIRLEFSKKEAGRQKEVIRLQQLLSEQKRQAEDAINAERKVWEDRIDAIKKIPTGCMPPDILRELRASGVYTGRIPCK
jgi:hypothetical protein